MALKAESKLTLAKLAELAGVSTSTASRALKDNPLIKEETRTRIQALAREHNFSVNAAASRLRTQKTHVIAVILNLIDHTEQSVSDPFLLKIVAELNKALNAAGYEMLLSNSFMASDDWASYFVSSQRADGIIVVGQGKSTEKIDKAAAARVPIVVWGEPHTKADYPIIGGDNYAGGYMATKHLIESGSKRILFLGDPGHAEMEQRHKGYEDAHRDAGLSVSADYTKPIDITSTAAYECINDAIKQQGLYFDGLICVSDMVAFGAIKALKERYVGIPGDVRIIGYDDIMLAELMHPALTTVHQNVTMAAQLMVEQLLCQVNQQPVSSQVVETHLVKRLSS